MGTESRGLQLLAIHSPMFPISCLPGLRPWLRGDVRLTAPNLVRRLLAGFSESGIASFAVQRTGGHGGARSGAERGSWPADSPVLPRRMDGRHAAES